MKISLESQEVELPERVLLKIFDSYFSTDQNSSVETLIDDSKRVLPALSKRVKSATCMNYLPEVKTNPVIRTHINPLGLTGETNSLLIMENATTICTDYKRGLRHKQYIVETLAEGAYGIELYQKALLEKRPYKVVILDLTTPGKMGNIETIIRLRRIDPKIKVIVISSPKYRAVLSNYQEYSFVRVIFKPIKMKELYETLENLLLSH